MKYDPLQQADKLISQNRNELNELRIKIRINQAIEIKLVQTISDLLDLRDKLKVKETDGCSNPIRYGG